MLSSECGEYPDSVRRLLSLSLLGRVVTFEFDNQQGLRGISQCRIFSKISHTINENGWPRRRNDPSGCARGGGNRDTYDMHQQEIKIVSDGESILTRRTGGNDFHSWPIVVNGTIKFTIVLINEVE